MPDYMIDVHNLTKRFGQKTVVDQFSVQVPKGQIYGFLGPNGSGKTTTLRMLCGLLTPNEGTGSCLGFDLLTEADLIKRRIGYMTQKFSFWEDLSIEENLKFVAEAYELENPQQKIASALESLNLTARKKQLAGELSGGWKQRLALAACTLHGPEMLLLDEPTAGVDPQARREFWDEIHKLAARGMTVLVSTHYMDEAERCHAIIYMSYGRLVIKGTLQEVIDGAGLHTWIVKGPDLMQLAETIKRLEAVQTVAPFGDSLHISGPDSTALQAALEPYFDGEHDWQQGKPTLEDAFIRYMAKVKVE